MALGAAALANADQSPAPSASTGSSPGTAGGGTAAGGRANGNTDPPKPMRCDEQLLTGDAARFAVANVQTGGPGGAGGRAQRTGQQGQAPSYSATGSRPLTGSVR